MSHLQRRWQQGGAISRYGRVTIHLGGRVISDRITIECLKVGVELVAHAPHLDLRSIALREDKLFVEWRGLRGTEEGQTDC